MLWVISRQKIRSPNCVSLASDTDRIADIARGRFRAKQLEPECGNRVSCGLMSALGHSRPSHFVPVLNNVRYASDSDHSRYESELTLWAKRWGNRPAFLWIAE